MGRRVAEHLRRQVVSLDGLWDFVFIGEADADDVDIDAISFDDAMAVPGCWDATPAYAGRRGLAALRTVAHVMDGTAHELVFDSVQHACRVMVDRELRVTHSGGFTRFRVPIPAGDARAIEIVVLVDNREDPHRSPLHQDSYDWYHYGGIAGSVALHRLGEQWISRLRATTISISPDPVLELVIDAGASVPARVALTVRVDGEAVLDEAVDLEVTTRIVRRIELPGARLWSLEEPALHLLEAALGADDYRQRIGLRTVTIEGRSICINHQAVRLLGVNRHDSHPDHGFALPDDQRLSDLQLISSLGANFVRGSHYPQAEGFLDLCDERGIAVWCEATAWQPDVRQLGDAHWLEAAEHNIDEMVAMGANHPSIVVWGCCNEGDSKDPACRPGFARLLNHLRAADPSRPAAYATMLPFESPEASADLGDLISVNTYPGWYWGRSSDVSAELDRIEQALASAALDDRPLVVSEIGGEAIPGWHDHAAAPWSEEYQADLIESVITNVTDPRRTICALALWVFADFRTPAAHPRIVRRPRAHNNKGLFDEHRRPKLAAASVQRLFGSTHPQAGD